MSLPDPTLLDIFAAEQAEHVSRMRSLLDAFDPEAGDASAIEELLRRAHTLKGAARAAGFDPTELLMHSLEGAFAVLRSGERQFRPELLPIFLRSLEAAEDILAAVLAQRPVPDIQGLLHDVERSMGAQPATVPPPTPPKPEQPPENGSAAPAAELVRVNAAHLDEWMTSSSELVAASSASDSELAEGPPRADDALREWWRLRQDAAPALRSMHRAPEFAPVLDCIHGAERQIKRLASAIRSDAASRQRREWDLQRLAERLEESALRVRMVTADTVFGPFGPMLRSLAEEHSKQIEYRAEGLDLLADRVVLQLLKDPVMHLLRNALSHGVEPMDERIAAGKPPAGAIRLLLRSRGERLQVVVEDDGRGIDRRAVADEAARQGIRDSADGLEDLIFRPGFSTSTLTTLSGRGIGLAVVQHEVARLHGEVRVRSEAKKGTSITISVPLSISSQHVLLVTAAGYTFGIPTAFVEQLTRVKRSAVETFEGKPAIVTGSVPIGLARLSSLLDLPVSAESGAADTMNIVVVASRNRRAAIAVETMLEVRDAVIKPLGLSAGERGLGAGAVPLANGEVAVILSVGGLLQRLQQSGSSRVASFAGAEPGAPLHKILVVDDSMTTRALEKSLLEAHGYQVQVAVDGVEALEKLRAEPADLVITDLMMPRLDGFQLLEQIRQDQALTKTPVIIVSSMESREDQERGLALGADAFIVKRKFDQRDLLETVRQIL